MYCGEVGGLAASSSKTLSTGGHDERLVGQTFIFSPIHAMLIVDGSLNTDGTDDKVQYWRKSNGIEDLLAPLKSS